MFFWGDRTIANLMETWEFEMISPLASGKLTVCLWNIYISNRENNDRTKRVFFPMAMEPLDKKST